MTYIFVFDPAYIKRATAKIDYWGIGLLAVGIGALQIMLDKGQEDNWFSSRFITTLAILAGGGLVLFVVRELMAEHPVVDLQVFRNRSYATGVFLMTVLGFVLYGSTVLVPLLMQTLLGYPALQAGIAMLPRGLGSFIMMPVVGFLMSKIEARRLLATGILVATFSFWDFAHLNLNVGYWNFFWPLIIQGASMGFLFVPLTTITNDQIPKEKIGNATSLFNLMRNIGASIGIATVVTLQSRHAQQHINNLSGHVSPYNPVTQNILSRIISLLTSRGADVVTATHQAYAVLFGMIKKQAAIMAYNDVFALLSFTFAAMFPLIFLMQKPKHTQGGAETAVH